ncbi:MAG: response regulator transcription factor [Chloroflexi bacterium]|nr:response regulator transcription factor [Chloroflexota bacterium]
MVYDSEGGERVRILIVDDDPNILEAISLSFQLQWQECQVLTATDGRKGLDLFFESEPDAVILDVAMPEMNGYEVLRRIRQVSDVPLLMLTAMGEEMDKVKGLELGADDYVTKPFSHLELFARIKAVLRRAELPPPINAAPSFVAGEIAINFGSREVTRRGEPVKLTPTEYNLLYQLVRNAGRVLPHETLLARVWGDEYRDDDDYLKVYISRLRHKLEDDPEKPRCILTERGRGYRFARPPVRPAERG